MTDKSWSELSSNCPIDLSRIERYSKEFDSFIPNKVTLENLDKSKKDVFDARSCLIQTLHIPNNL